MTGELQTRLANGEFIATPGVFELSSTKIADQMNFLVPAAS